MHGKWLNNNNKGHSLSFKSIVVWIKKLIKKKHVKSVFLNYKYYIIYDIVLDIRYISLYNYKHRFIFQRVIDQ